MIWKLIESSMDLYTAQSSSPLTFFALSLFIRGEVHKTHVFAIIFAKKNPQTAVEIAKIRS